MEFNLDKFASTDFHPREEDVAVPDLKAFFSGKAEKDEDGKDKQKQLEVRLRGRRQRQIVGVSRTHGPVNDRCDHHPAKGVNDDYREEKDDQVSHRAGKGCKRLHHFIFDL
jgi:hypothetical protein